MTEEELKKAIRLLITWYDGEGERIDGYVEPEVLEERKCESCGSILERKVKIPDVS